MIPLTFCQVEELTGSRA